MRKRYYKEFGTSVINSQLSPLSLWQLRLQYCGIYLELWAEDDYNENTDSAIENLTQQGKVNLFPVWL